MTYAAAELRSAMMTMSAMKQRDDVNSVREEGWEKAEGSASSERSQQLPSKKLEERVRKVLKRIAGRDPGRMDWGI